MDYIRLRNIRLHAYHGCLDEEKILGSTFEINVQLGLDLSRAGKSGKIEDTVNYAEVYDLIRREMQQRENLLEKAAYRTAEKIMDTFPQVECVEFSLAKLHPPLPGQMEKSEITIRLKRHS